MLGQEYVTRFHSPSVERSIPPVYDSDKFFYKLISSPAGEPFILLLIIGAYFIVIR